jgi:hypothetical protein
MSLTINAKLSMSLCVLMLPLFGCSLVGEAGSPQQVAQAEAVYRFDENRTPYGMRVAAAEALYRPQVYGLNPYFGR